MLECKISNWCTCTHTQLCVLCNAQAATALGLESIEVKGADQKKSHAVPGILSKKKIVETPVPTQTVIVPVTMVPVATAPAVAVSGMDTLSRADCSAFCKLQLPARVNRANRQAHMSTHIPASIDRLHEG